MYEYIIAILLLNFYVLILFLYINTIVYLDKAKQRLR